jgi:hypothetical protein
MFQWFADPLFATDSGNGFEILVHGLVVMTKVGDIQVVQALCVDEAGYLHTIPVESGRIRLTYRYKRGEGWDTIKDPAESSD